MPRRLICIFGTEFYRDHARLLASYMVRNKYEQLVYCVESGTSLSYQPSPPKSSGFSGLLQRKSPVLKKVSPSLYTKAVSDAYEFLSKRYQPGDKIVLFPITGLEEDWSVLRIVTRELAEHLEAGTEPLRVAPDPDPAEPTDGDIFGDRPRVELHNRILGKRIESSLAIVYRSTGRITEINNFLLDEFPLSVKQIFTFNWASGLENYCNTLRDDAGQVTSREVCYFKGIQWHIPAVTNATMNFIRYQYDHTKAWVSIRPSILQTLTSLPVPLIPESPPPPAIAPPRTTRKPGFIIRFGRKQKSSPKNNTLPNQRPDRRSSTLMSGYTTSRRSDILMSSFTSDPFATPISSPPLTPTSTLPFFPSKDYGSTSDLTTSSHTSFRMTQSPRGSTDLTHSSRSSIESPHPELREAYIALPGMTKHQVWTYPAFGGLTDNYGLPERVVWRSSRE